MTYIVSYSVPMVELATTQSEQDILVKGQSGGHSSKKLTYLAIALFFVSMATGDFIALQPRAAHMRLRHYAFRFHRRFPPRSDEAGDISEPIWDSLVLSVVAILSPLRAYYLHSAGHQGFDFDFGKNQQKQSITFAADSTVEPGEDDLNGFLVSGFAGQRRDFEAVKAYVEKGSVLNATRFLAHRLAGLDHRKAHVSST
ncbi:hypothetical protein GGR51DRAFT_551746 [Nemania sp. FL0031]|nr:hypothetical protein GGR51DRAFT_551746 [Nemania sp. FL0031]